MAFGRRRAPTLWGIVAFKVIKGLVFLLVALGVYALIDRNLPAEFRRSLTWFNIDPEQEFWSNLARGLASITSARVRVLASGAGLYAGLSLSEAIGLGLRQGWAAWLAIAEGAFFIPIELFELARHFSAGILAVLAINVLIVAYLFRNRNRLFTLDGATSGERSKPAS